MALTAQADGSVAARRADAHRKLNDDLRQIDERLRFMVDVYQEKPSIFDDDLLNAADGISDIEVTITEAYRIMKTQVYIEDTSFRLDDDLWEAFQEQEDEFGYFYKSALIAIEAYRKVLRTYSRLKEARPRLRHGDLERIRQDEHAQARERAACIEAMSDFQGKFSTTLAALFSID